ncbi:uncharacterized protein LOC135089148 isoform X7 [Scylla paramamosain]|uniref:uncharacterized protein LOC135089148 isoform X7 n=1 Tax=Scylla paramamosain TaxID=85552 RepID=UPI003082EE5B
MGPRREKMREFRRQGDPTFPPAVKPAVKSRPSKPPPPRPSEPPPAIPTESSASPQKEFPAISDLTPTRPPEGVLKGHKGRRKGKNKKDLRVSFDMENTQERIVPVTEEEEAVVECWEDLSDGDAWASGALQGFDNSSDGRDDSQGTGGGEQRLSEMAESLEGFTYFGVSYSDDKQEDEGLDPQECYPSADLIDSGEVTYTHQRGLVTDLDIMEAPVDTSLDTGLTDVNYPERVTDVSPLEGVTDMSHSDEVYEVSHKEGLTDVSQPDELNDVSVLSLEVSHDQLSHIEEVTDMSNPEQLTNATNFVELKDEIGNEELPTDVKLSDEVSSMSQLEGLTDINHLEGLTDVTFPEELSDTSQLEEMTCSTESSNLCHPEGVTDVSPPEGLIDESYSENASEPSHLEEPSDLNNSKESDVRQLRAQTEVTYPGVVDDNNLHSLDVSHDELNSCEGPASVSQPEKLTALTSEELYSGSSNERLIGINPDDMTAVSRDRVNDQAALTGHQGDALFVVNDTDILAGESLIETPGTGDEGSCSFPTIVSEADRHTGPAMSLACRDETPLVAPPPSFETEVDKPDGDLEDDDDEWETEPSGESNETSENTWEAVETEDNTCAGQLLADDGGEDSDSFIPNDDIEAVLLALIEDQEKALPPPAPYVSQTAAQKEERTQAATEPLKEEKGSEREASPEVTIGYECRDRKSTFYASETESEGELVPCEDKCVGTTDHSDEDLNLSARENVPREAGVSQNTMNKCQEKDLSLDTSKQYTLAAPEVQVGGSSPSPEIPEVPEEGKCMGNSESAKEKDKINGKKTVKKKGKKNKRDVKVEPVVIPPDVTERPKLVRGRAWKEKKERINAHRMALLNLSFGKEICEPEVVEGTSNLLTETYTETTLLTPTRCPLGTTVFTEMPCTACSSVSGEFSEPDSLHDNCKCREQQLQDAGLVALVAEVKTCKEAPKPPSPVLVSSLSPSTVTVQVTGASDEEDCRAYEVPSPTEDTNEFFIVKTQTVASPSQVLKEYVEDTESEDEAKLQEEEDSKANVSQELPAVTCESPPTSEISSSKTGENEDSIYIDADGSRCSDTISDSFDYEKSFPNVLGTQQLNLIYSYDSGPDSDVESGQGSIESGGQTLDPEGSDMNTNLEKDGDGDRMYSSGWGEIIYEGPCLCGETEAMSERRSPSAGQGGGGGAGVSSAEEQFCVPAVRVSDATDVVAGDGNEAKEEDTGSEFPPDIMGSNQEDQGSESVGSAKDIRLRINEIVGARLLRDRGRGASPGVKEEGGAREEHLGGREESPLPGSSPASSSGVQGSDEMSLSRSRSRSPSREESVSPGCSPRSVPESPAEPRPSHSPQQDRYEREALESLRALRFEGNIETSPEKSVPVDCSFRTFRDMYQINPIYLTDSDDHDDLNESDTVVPVSTSLDYDPERSITVTNCSPDPPELRPSPPLHGTHATKKVPKVTKLLRETQGIVQRWEVLQAQAVERQRQSSQVRELQRQVKTLRLSLEALGKHASELTKADDIDSRVKLIQKLQEAKALQLEVSARKTEVSSINLAVHRFLTETGYSLASLKDDVADLYRLWDEADRRVSSEVSRLENVDAAWKLWESQAEELTKMLRQDSDTLRVLDVAIQTGSMTDTTTASMQGVARLLNEKRKTQPGKKFLLQHTKTQSVDIQGSSLSLTASGDECLSDSGTSGYESCSSEELSERERRLANLRRLARDLEASLHPNSQAWAAICKTLSSAEAELKGLQQHCRELVVRSSETLDQAKTSPQLRRRMWSKDCKVGKACRRSNTVSGSGRGGSRRGWVWRVVRAALPFQAALLLLFCVACLLEPNCCDHVNTLNLSLSPQLRYVHGPPPV